MSRHGESGRRVTANEDCAGQGDEPEAMRHWRNALDQIYEHNATKIPPSYTAQTDTEKALQDALRELELQCKERIDILEALRASRQSDEEIATRSATKLTKSPFTLPAKDTSSKSTGSIGEGTIPAVAYSDLSRPTLAQRPSLPERTSSEVAVVSGSGSGSPLLFASPPPNNMARTMSPHVAARKPDKDVRSSSPERHTMRTTLRAGRSNEKTSRSSRKTKPAAEGPSKAATLAWSSLGSRERLFRVSPSDSSAAVGTSSSSSSLPNPSKSFFGQQPKTNHSQLQWDSHSRRLVQPRGIDSANVAQAAKGRHSDEYPLGRPSGLSINAASSALGYSSNYESTPLDQPPLRQDRMGSGRVNPVTVPPQKAAWFEPPSNNMPLVNDESGDSSEKRTSSSGRARGSADAKLRTGTPHRGRNEAQPTNRPRRRERPRQTPRSSSSDDGFGASGETTVRGRPEGDNSITVARDQSKELAAPEDGDSKAWKRKKKQILKNLPPGIEEAAATQILNDIIVQGDEVHWGDIAGLEVAKNALRETVVYPFLRPDLFMGLREPARGMLLFGPPGTGKTMLARAVATESKSTFFSISASSLTSKYLGESEKLVKALFGLARSLAPSIIFVDEIDSLLSQRSGSGEHEATRRIKTEFLIQWSDLQRAAAGRETTEKDKERGDANRVLVLAATNLPWAIDEAARRRFVRRQYIPLPEPETRETQLRTLLGQQKHNLSEDDISVLVTLTDGKSGRR